MQPVDITLPLEIVSDKTMIFNRILKELTFIIELYKQDYTRAVFSISDCGTEKN